MEIRTHFRETFLITDLCYAGSVMALGENPKKIAMDVADGLRTFNTANLRRFDPPDLKVIVGSLNEAQSDLRMIIISMDDPEYTEKMKEKNRRISRIRNALTIIRSFVHRRGLKGVF